MQNTFTVQQSIVRALLTLGLLVLVLMAMAKLSGQTSPSSSPSSSTPVEKQPASTPAKSPSSSTPQSPAILPTTSLFLSPDEVELWLESLVRVQELANQYNESIRVRDAVLEQIRRDHNCPKCDLIKTNVPGKPNKAGYSLKPPSSLPILPTPNSNPK
jgi:hypothetical protein